MQVPFARDSYSSEVPINWYPATDTDRGAVMMGAPGMNAVVTPEANTEVRAMKVVADILYAVCGNKVWKIDSAYATTLLGTINTSTGKVWIETNGVQICFMDSNEGWVYTIFTGVFAQITDVDFPGGTSLTYQDGYGIFIHPASGQFWLTALYDFTTITGTDYASAEGWPDNLIAALMNYRELWLFGTESIEIWYNAGASPFPFARVQGGFIEQGCAAAASVAKGDNVVYWLAASRQVMQASGYNPKIISTRKMEREIEEYTVISDALAWFQVYEGHSFYWLVFPTANATWVYDAATQVWHKRASFPKQSRHRANCYAYWLKKHYVGDYTSGIIYEMSGTYYDDDGTELIAELQSPELINEGKKMYFSGLQLTFEQGHVDLDRQPQAMLQWSDDGGNVWSNEVWADVGDLGQYGTRTQWRRLGSSYRRIFKLRMSDAVNRDILAVNWL